MDDLYCPICNKAPEIHETGKVIYCGNECHYLELTLPEAIGRRMTTDEINEILKNHWREYFNKK